MKTIIIKVGFLSSEKYEDSIWTDRVIEWWTKGQYFHTALFVPIDTKVKDPKFFKMFTASGKKGKVWSDIKTLNSDKWDYVDIEIDERYLDIIIKFFEVIMGEKYDWLGILGFILPFKDRDNEWFCSETVANALKIIGDKRFWIKDPSNISPNKLAYMLGLLPELNKGNMIKRFIKHVIFNKENK